MFPENPAFCAMGKTWTSELLLKLRLVPQPRWPWRNMTVGAHSLWLSSERAKGHASAFSGALAPAHFYVCFCCSCLPTILWNPKTSWKALQHELHAPGLLGGSPMARWASSPSALPWGTALTAAYSCCPATCTNSRSAAEEALAIAVSSSAPRAKERTKLCSVWTVSQWTCLLFSR